MEMQKSTSSRARKRKPPSNSGKLEASFCTVCVVGAETCAVCGFLLFVRHWILLFRLARTLLLFFCKLGKRSGICRTIIKAWKFSMVQMEMISRSRFETLDQEVSVIWGFGRVMNQKIVCFQCVKL